MKECHLISYLICSQEGKAAQLYMWLEECVDGLNAGQSDIHVHTNNILSSTCVTFFTLSNVIYCSVAPIVRSGETDPEVARYLNRYELILLFLSLESINFNVI